MVSDKIFYNPYDLNITFYNTMIQQIIFNSNI